MYKFFVYSKLNVGESFIVKGVYSKNIVIIHEKKNATCINFKNMLSYENGILIKWIINNSVFHKTHALKYAWRNKNAKTS